jgi:hypothetical protein
MRVDRDKLIELITTALMRAADRQGLRERERFLCPDDLRGRDIVRVLREHSPAVAAKAYEEDVGDEGTHIRIGLHRKHCRCR